MPTLHESVFMLDSHKQGSFEHFHAYAQRVCASASVVASVFFECVGDGGTRDGFLFARWEVGIEVEGIRVALPLERTHCPYKGNKHRTNVKASQES